MLKKSSDDNHRRLSAQNAATERNNLPTRIARLIDGGTTDDGLPYFVAPLIAGGSLEDRLRDEGRLDIGATLHVAAQEPDLAGEEAEALDFG